MYNFKDTSQMWNDELNFPSEALRINGAYLEDIVPGYRTLSVTGREGLSKEIETFEVGASHGSNFLRSKYPERVITVTYMLKANTPQNFRREFNKLAQYLDCENAELIFADEPDKYFIGTPMNVEEVDGGKLNVIGTFDLLCTNPFKYSTTERIVEGHDGEFSITYNGTHKAYPQLEVTFFDEVEADENGVETPLTGKGDCGFIAFYNDDGKGLEFGDLNETDEDLIPQKSETILNYKFDSAKSYNTYVKNHWTLNNGIFFSPKVHQMGSLAMKKISSDSSVYYLAPSSFGSSDQWHGPSFLRKLTKPSKNFNFSWYHKMAIGDNKTGQNQLGEFQALVYSGSGGSRKILAGISIYKDSYGKKAALRYFVNGQAIKEKPIDLSVNNKVHSRMHRLSISKEGPMIRFHLPDGEMNWFDGLISDTQATEVAFFMGKWGNNPALTYNGLYSVKFVRNIEEHWEDVPNKFSAGDILTVNCSEGKPYLNGEIAARLGALGNDWEDFCLKPGINHIGYSFSDWLDSAHAPKIKLKYREVFI